MNLNTCLEMVVLFSLLHMLGWHSQSAHGVLYKPSFSHPLPLTHQPTLRWMADLTNDNMFTVHKEVYQIINIATNITPTFTLYFYFFYHKAICCKLWPYELIKHGDVTQQRDAYFAWQHVCVCVCVYVCVCVTTVQQYVCIALLSPPGI